MSGLHKRKNKWRAPALMLLAGASLSAAGCGQKTAAGGPGAGGPRAMPVQVQVAQSVRIPDTTEYLSVLKSRQSAVINPQVEGQITKIFVKSGDQVNAGTPLLQIDPLKQEATVNSQAATLASQEANLRLAKISLERAQKLYAAGVTSKQDFDNAQSNYDAIAAQVRALEQQVEQQKVELHYYKVSAPANGIVGDIPVHVGDRVTFTTLLTTVDLPGALEAYIYVPADRAKDLRLGLPVRLLGETGETVSDTHITFVSPQVETDTQTVLAKAAIENARDKLRIAQQVRAQVTWGSHDGPVVPVLAVHNLVTVTPTANAQVISHYNLFRSAEIDGSAAPGHSSGEGIGAMEELSKKALPQGMTFEWSGLSLEEIQSGGKALILFGLGLIVVYLTLAAQYESFVLPFIVLMAVPVAILGALGAQALRGLQNDVYCQIGLVMLIGLASKNAILIVEFAEQLREQGMTIVEAAIEAARIRLRPILMTSFAFILGVVPLVLARGAGRAGRISVGTTVFGGMIAATTLNLLFIPVLYVIVKSIFPGGRSKTVALEH